jgi:excisionase family DNA binding protein
VDIVDTTDSEGNRMANPIIEKALKASNTPKKDRYTPEEVARIIGVPIETIRRKLREGLLLGHKIGRKWLYVYHDDLERLLGGHK